MKPTFAKAYQVDALTERQQWAGTEKLDLNAYRTPVQTEASWARYVILLVAAFASSFAVVAAYKWLV